MGSDLGLPRERVFGAFTWGLLVAGTSAPLAGRIADRYGGRSALIAGALLGASGFVVLGCSHTFAGLLVAWTLNGAAMALGLYEVCFATIGQVAPFEYRRLVIGVTLIAGFASTVSWPASHYLLPAVGWRPLCFMYALMLGVCPLLYGLVPRHHTNSEEARAEPLECRDDTAPGVRSRVRVLAWTFAGMAFIGAALNAHLFVVLKASRVDADVAVWTASSIGVLQVFGRSMHGVFGGPDAARLGLLTFIGFFAAMVFLLAAGHASWFVIGFAVFYGVANGFITLVKATLPVQLLGSHDIGHLLGTFGRPALIARALAPWLFAMTMDSWGVDVAVVGLVLTSGATLVAYASIAMRVVWR